MSMARLWRDQGKRDEARELLAPVLGGLPVSRDRFVADVAASPCGTTLPGSAGWRGLTSPTLDAGAMMPPRSSKVEGRPVSSSGSLAMFTAMRAASSRVSKRAAYSITSLAVASINGATNERRHFLLAPS
jgi:hypothetical protein